MSPRPLSLIAPDAAPPRPEPPSAAPPWLPPAPSPAAIASESPLHSVARHRSLRLCPTNAVVRLAHSCSVVWRERESGDYETSMDQIRRPTGEKEGERKKREKQRKRNKEKKNRKGKKKKKETKKEMKEKKKEKRKKGKIGEKKMNYIFINCVMKLY
jgi:hypothetical protein